jgi:hypothetical protein
MVFGVGKAKGEVLKGALNTNLGGNAGLGNDCRVLEKIEGR